MQSYDKYILSTSIHYISNSGRDERNGSRGGNAEDQTGHEWELRAWYDRPWSAVLRYPSIRVGLKIAQLACAAALNDKIGYDQGQRTSYWTQLKKAGCDPSRIDVPCEEDCTAGVTANVKAAGCLLGVAPLANLAVDTYSGNMKARFVSAGFVALTAGKYTGQCGYLLPGDILLYEGHHAATNISYGKCVRDQAPSGELPDEEDGGLCRGDRGAAVVALQRALLAWRGDCLPQFGPDGDFGDETEQALKAFQQETGLPATGVCDEATWDALEGEDQDEKTEQEKTWVEITGDSVNVRSAPGIDHAVLGVVRRGDRLPWQQEAYTLEGTAWYRVAFAGEPGWVSGKYARLCQ